MALATKCPECGALFRVVADQLKLRGGLVRCGQCRTVFDAIGSLTYVDDGTMTQTRPMYPPAASTTALIAASTALPKAASTAALPQKSRGKSTRHAQSRALGPTTTLRIAPGTLPVAGKPAARAARADTAAANLGADLGAAETAAGVPTLMSPELLRDRLEEPRTASATQTAPSAHSPADGIEVIELAAPAHTKATSQTAAAVEEPAFIRATQRAPRRGFSVFFGGGSFLLGVFALIQLAVVFRTDLMTRWPQLRPALVQVCATFGCSLGWPAQPDQLAVMGSELQAIAGTDVLELTAVVRNRASFTQALPALEVTLTDARNRAVARKVFTAGDYLGAAGESRARIDEGLAAGTDLTIRVYFEARGVQPAGFLVYPFHL